MPREGQDGINTDAASMDHNIPVVAYYIDGPYAWTDQEIALFPNSVHVRIATRWTTQDGHFIDCELGDASPAEAVQWIGHRRASGYGYPGVYVSVSKQQAVIQACLAVHESLPGWWLAHWDDLDELPAGAWGKQYASQANLDKSIWADIIPGIDNGVTPIGPPPVPGKIPAGTILTFGTRGAYVQLLQAALNKQYPAYSHLAVDGVYGPLTAAVVREFQQRDHLLVDGIAGPQTLGALYLTGS